MIARKSSCELILASQSPRRKALLSRVGIKFNVVPAQVEEPPFASPQDPRDYATQLAKMKAAHVARSFPKHWVLGADTIVVVEGQVLGKPSSAQDACRMLSHLSGNTHQVMTGCAIVSAGQHREFSSLVRTQVTFKTLSDKEIRWYVASGEPFDKAGGYAIQGLGAHLVKQINGSYTNVVGLPLCEVVEFLDGVGLTPFSGTTPACPSRGGTRGSDG